jgi:hypothetical protein
MRPSLMVLPCKLPSCLVILLRRLMIYFSSMSLHCPLGKFLLHCCDETCHEAYSATVQATILPGNTLEKTQELYFSMISHCQDSSFSMPALLPLELSNPTASTQHTKYPIFIPSSNNLCQVWLLEIIDNLDGGDFRSIT